MTTTCQWPFCPTDHFGPLCRCGEVPAARYGSPTAEMIEQGRRDAFEAMCAMNGQDPEMMLKAWGRAEADLRREEPKELTVTVTVQLH